jgi:IMP cyclohydrolase
MRLEDNVSDYPGRGLIHMVDTAGVSTWVYFITGRSDASKARRVRADPDGLVVVPTEHSADSDALRHYACARWANDILVVGNGDHVDVIASGLKQGHSLKQITALIDPEPDPPIWTPRIALAMGSKVHFISVSRSDDKIARHIRETPREPGVASVLTTYSGTAIEPTGNAPFAEAPELRSAQTMCEDLFYAHLTEQHRVLLVAGSPTPVSAPRVELLFVLS